ncbi:MAG: tetratricopeptide repeat protein [Chitinophagales bacterium]|nr:tetratricopeptide repeat protein [Chitinophagales bacterium]
MGLLSRYLLIFLICAGYYSGIHAQPLQDRVTDAIAKLKNAPNDSNKVILLCDISADYFNIEPDSGIHYGKRALGLANELDYSYGIALANKSIGRCYAILGRYPEALEHFNTALDIAEKIKNDDLESTVCVSLGSVYFEKNEPEKALDLYLKGKEAYIRAGKSTAIVLHSIGNLYHSQKKYEESLEAYMDAIKQGEERGDMTIALARTYSSAGGTYADLRNYAKAFPYLFKALNIQEKHGAERSIAFTCNNIGTTYFYTVTKPSANLPDSLRNKTAMLNKALTYLKRSVAISEKMGLMELRESLYHNISDVYIELGDYRNSYHFIRRSIEIGDSMRNFEEEKRFAKVEAEFQVKQKTDSLKFANELKDGQIEKRKTERNSIIAVLVLVGITGLLFVNRQNIRRKKLQAEKELANNKLKTAQNRLSNFTESLKEKNRLIEDFSAEIERLQSLPCSNELPYTKENLTKLQNSIILTEEQWEDFRDTFEEVHEGFFMRLKAKIPGLTAGETRFMALSKLGLNNKEMARMQGISLSGMRNYKHRMRVKLNISEDSELEQILADI